MGLLSSIAKNFNPVKLVSSAIGGTLGKAVGIATNIVTGIAQGKSFGEIMKGVLKDVAALGISAAVTYFTGGTAGLFVNALLDKAKGIIGEVAGKVAASALARPVSSWLAGQLTGFGESLTTDLVRRQVTDVVLRATGLKDEHQRLEQAHLEALQSSSGFADFLQQHFESISTPAARATTQASFGGGVDLFEAR
jgi:hypothetical protein